MYVKSIVLDGFKSYGHRTEITGFDSQFNAITGLNGSGKSNVLDSICFVLGITNLTHVRAKSLQDLIYKSGQCGINKATVSITFDNRNPEQCPPGFEGVCEITITRQIVMGGKNKYMINGTTVPNKKVQDLFCSVQLNINNPHFLIMQGKITKVLNMKPFDILGMIEEAAGTKMYEVKKQAAQKTIEKKDAKLCELRTIIDEELCPKLEKARNERAKYMQYKNVERELDHLLRLYQAWEYIMLQKKAAEAQQALKNQEKEIEDFQTNINNNKNAIELIEIEIKEAAKKAEADESKRLQEVEEKLKEAERSQTKMNALIKSIKENINAEEKKKKDLQKNLSDDEKVLSSKESELAKAEQMFQQLKEDDENDTQAVEASEKRLEALLAGMELNEEGKAETLQEQLMNAREEAAKTKTEMKQATMQLNHCRNQLKEKQKQRTSDASTLQRDKQNLDAATNEVNRLEASIKKLNFSEDTMSELHTKRKQLTNECRVLRDRIDNFEAQRPYTKFHYRDPEPNFNRRKVDGVVCRLIDVKNDWANIAVETVAGGRLYNVVIDTEETGKKLLQRGDLQTRTTFIPINKIRANKMNDNIIRLAQELVGKENVQPALAHINYDKKLQVVMEFIFGSAFVCKDLNVAKRIAFHESIKKKCVTLDGDVVDPAGTLSGGARQKGGSVLAQLEQIMKYEEELKMKESELNQIEAQLRDVGSKQNQYSNLKQQLEIKQHEVNLITQRLQQTSHYKNQEEIHNLKVQIEELESTIKSKEESEKTLQKKIKELEGKVANSKGGRDQQIKEAEKEMKMLKAKSDKSKQKWKEVEQNYEMFKLEISELKKSLENTQKQIEATEESIKNLKAELEDKMISSEEINVKVSNLQAEVKSQKGAIAEKNKGMQLKVRKKEELQSQIMDFEIKIKEYSHNLKKLKEDYKKYRAKEKDCERNVQESSLTEAEKLSIEEGKSLERKIRQAQEAKNTLGRTINAKAHTLFEQQEKEYNDVRKKQKIVEQDKKKIIQVIANLDKKKEEILKKAYDQISKDFGSIFSTLLPGANAKLLPPTGQTILQGLEVKIFLGGVWKESLTELSGGQRSLAALSLILAMLLFKPAPLYILDEVDAALDLSHTQNIGNMLKTHFKKSQFIIVSLKDGMFNNANVLFRTQFIDGVSSISRTVNKTGS